MAYNLKTRSNNHITIYNSGAHDQVASGYKKKKPVERVRGVWQKGSYGGAGADKRSVATSVQASSVVARPVPSSLASAWSTETTRTKDKSYILQEKNNNKKT